MRNLLITAALLVTTAGTAMADRHYDNRGRRETVVRDNRGYRGRDVVSRRDYGRSDYGRRDYGRRDYGRRDYGNRFGGYRGDFRYHDHRPVFINNGRYVFNGGYSYNYVRPYYGHYRNFRVRPTLLIENVDTIPGYIWVRGNWVWDGVEWQWSPGHYVVDSSFVYDGY